MALQMGMNITESDMKTLLERNDKLQSGVRTWRQLFGNAALGANARTGALTADYSDAIAKAYEANFARRNSIFDTGLSTGAMRDLVSANRADLSAAYDTYIRNYNQDMNTVLEDYNKEVQTIDADLTQRAKNFASLYQKAYKYLSDELVRGSSGENTYLSDNDLNWVLNKEGGISDWNTLSHRLFNPDGSLTMEGTKFFDQMFNAMPQGYVDAEGNKIRSFDEWLTNEDPELRDWWVSPDYHNYTKDGRNVGTANVLTGRESTDYAYNKSEYITESDIDKLTFTADNDLAKSAEEAYREARDYEAKPPAQADLFSYNARKKTIEALNTRAEKAWNTYRDTLSKDIGNVLSNFKTIVGSAKYTEFNEVNKDLIEQYDTLIDKLLSTGSYDSRIIADIENWYDSLYKKMDAFIRANKYTSNISGL